MKLTAKVPVEVPSLQLTLDDGRIVLISAGGYISASGGISAGGAMAVALRISRELENAVIVSIVCDRGDRYLSTGVFPD